MYKQRWIGNDKTRGKNPSEQGARKLKSPEIAIAIADCAQYRLKIDLPEVSSCVMMMLSSLEGPVASRDLRNIITPSTSKMRPKYLLVGYHCVERVESHFDDHETGHKGGQTENEEGDHC